MKEDSGGKPLFLLLLGIGFQQLTASGAYPIAKYGLAQIEPFTFAFFRFLLASTVLLTLAKLRGNKTPVDRKDWPRIFLLAVLIIPFNQTLFLVGQSMTAAGHGAVLFASTPIWVYILAMIFLGEKFMLFRTLGIIMAIVGVCVVMSVGALEVGTEYLLGDAIVLVSVLAWALYTVVAKPLVGKYGALKLTAYALSIGSALYFPWGLYRAIQFDYSGVTLGAWLSVVYLAVGLSIVVYVLWFWLLKYMEATRVAVYHNIQPIVASVVAYLWLGESLGATFIIGGMIVISGVVISELKVTPRRKRIAGSESSKAN